MRAAAAEAGAATGARVKRVGHKGADLLAPGNTAASFDAALAAGVDMIEFDVLSERPDGSGRLVLAHDYSHDVRHCPTLDEGLAHLAGPAFADVELDVDLKLAGYEQRVLAALAEYGLLGRSLLSTGDRTSLRRIGALAPDVVRGWSVPRLKRDYTTDALTAVPFLALALGYRRVFPAQAARMLRAGACEAIMAHWRLVTPRLLNAVRGAGGLLYVWTVDDGARIRDLESLGVDGIITNDPRLFPTN